MGLSTLAYMAVTAAVAYAANRLLQPKVDSKTPLSDSRTEPSVRGTLLPLLLGTNRVGPVVGYIGNRLITKEETEGGGGKGGGGDPPEQTIYNESAWHMIGLGPGKALRTVYSSGTVIFDGLLTPSTHPSGTRVDLGQEGSFLIYWGEQSQPVCTPLATQTGVSSSYPYTFYIYWDRKRLGTSPNWTDITYVVEVDAIPASVGGKPTYIEGDEYNETVPMNFQEVGGFRLTTTDFRAVEFIKGYDIVNTSLGYTGKIISVNYTGSLYEIEVDKFVKFTGTRNFTVSGQRFSGVNPAAILYHLLFETYPHGLGYDLSWFNQQDFTDLATRFAIDGTEIFPASIFLKNGRSFKDAIVMVMQDCGIFMWYDTNTGLLRFTAIREGDTPTIITQAGYWENDIGRQIAYATLQADRQAFTYVDLNRKFSQSTVLLTDDGAAKFSENPNTKKVELNTVTDIITATQVVSRREQENSVDSSVSVNIPYTLMNLEIGQLIFLEGDSQGYRLESKKPDPNDASVQIKLIADAYSIPNQYVNLTPSGYFPENNRGPIPDPIVILSETNRSVTPDQDGVFIFTIREHSQIAGSNKTISPDDVTFESVDANDYSTGGFLDEDFLDTTAVYIEEGPEFTPAGPDILNVRDLTGSDELWRSGSQVLIIGTEVCFVRNITAISADTFRLDGIIRARQGTSLESHTVDTPFVIANSSALVLARKTFITAGASVFAKSVPYTSPQSLSSDQVSSVGITYGGGGFRPFSVANLNTADSNNAWIAGDDIPLVWNYKNGTSKTGAGDILTGAAGVVAPPEGTFVLQILNGSTVVRTVTDLTSPSYTYTNADLVSDFGAEPSTFNVIVINTLNGLASPETQVTINRID